MDPNGDGGIRCRKFSEEKAGSKSMSMSPENNTLDSSSDGLNPSPPFKFPPRNITDVESRLLNLAKEKPSYRRHRRDDSSDDNEPVVKNKRKTKSPDRRASRSPRPPPRSRTPTKRSQSRDRKSPPTYRRKSRSPKQKTRSPDKRITRSPEKKVVSPARKKTRSPPSKQKVRSPDKRVSPPRKRTLSPRKQKKRSPEKRRSLSPRKRKGRSPSKSKSRRSSSRSPRRRRRSTRSKSKDRRRRSRSTSVDIRRKSRSRSTGRGKRSRSRDRHRSRGRRGYADSRSPSPMFTSKWGQKPAGICRAVLPANPDDKRSREVTTEDVEKRLAQHMQTVQQKAAEDAKKINLPGYLNPAMVNVHQFKQVQDKRKLLWSKAKEKTEIASAQWSGAFGDQDNDEKFRRLMGIQETNADGSSSTIQQSRKVLDDLEKEYEKSRAFQLSRGAGGLTGIGLGFGSAIQPQ